MAGFGTMFSRMREGSLPGKEKPDATPTMIADASSVSDAEQDRLGIEEFKRRMAATRNGDTGDITRGK